MGRAESRADTLAALAEIECEVIDCVRCPRLVEWRGRAARVAPRRFLGESYWARPLPGFGDPDAAIMILGLAPAANGGNRTGRIFTGDESGNFLWPALHAAGLNCPTVASDGDAIVRDGGWLRKSIRSAGGMQVAVGDRTATTGPRGGDI